MADDPGPGGEVMLISAGAPNCAAFSPDGALIAAVTIGDVRAWDAATGEHGITLTAPPGEQRPFRVAFFSPDGVLSVMRWPLIEAFDVRTGTRLDPPGRKLPRRTATRRSHRTVPASPAWSGRRGT